MTPHQGDHSARDPRVLGPDIVLDARPDPRAATDTLPTSSGVVVFTSADGRVIQTGATSNIKRFAQDRLGLSEDTHAAAVSHRDICAQIAVFRTGSAFEADWTTLTLARSDDPSLYPQLANRLKTPCLTLNDSTMTWSAAEIGSHDDTDHNASPLVGPTRTLDGARELGALLDERFDLCRYPLELAKSPDGTACAYKDMGKCPAPCDGSEPLDTYNARAARAFDKAKQGLENWSSELKGEIKAASESMHFERAAACKAELDALNKLPDDVRRNTKTLGGRVFVVVSRARKNGWCLLWTLGRSGLTRFACVDHAAEPSALAPILRRIEDTQGLAALTPLVLDELGLVSRALNHKPLSGATRRTHVLDAATLTPKSLTRAMSVCVSTSDEHAAERDGEDPIAYNSA